nr:MAG TPA: hypothetical protein [Caudoviricetes sp.]
MNKKQNCRGRAAPANFFEIFSTFFQNPLDILIEVCYNIYRKGVRKWKARRT